MRVRIEESDPTPVYEQLRRQLLALVHTGALRPGDRLPPIRQLAADLGVAPGTVAHAYRELEDGGVIASRRGAGTRVMATAVAARSPLELARLAEELVRVARADGWEDDAVRAAVDHALRAAAGSPVTAVPGRRSRSVQ